MRRLLALTLILCGMPAFAARHELTLQPRGIEQLGSLAAGDSLVVDDLPDGYGGRASLRFTRIDIYARGARLIVQGPDGERELPRSTRIELIGRDAGDRVRAQLAFDPGLRNIVGAGSGPSGSFAISARTDARGLHLVAQPADEALPKGVVPQVLPDGIEASTITSLRPVAVVLLKSTFVISSPHSATIERPNSKCTSRSPTERWLCTIENSEAKLGIGSFSGTS